MARILLYSLVSFLVALVTTPWIRDLFRRRGILDKPDQQRKLHAVAVPRVGGIAILLAYVTAMLLALMLPEEYGYAMNTQFPSLGKLLLATGLIFCTGLMDDLIQLKPWQKFAEQTTAALMAYLGGVQLHLFPNQEWDILISLPVTVVWLVACANAFNLIDGLDGLATGLGLFATVTMFLAALISNNTDLAFVMAPLAGALLGFLRYNFNPASVFLGDCGSLTVGFLIGCCGVLWSHKSASMLSLTAPLMATAIPLLDVSLTLVRRFLRHQPLFEGDRGHIHHRLLDRGLKPRDVALVMYALCGLFAVFSLLQSTLHQQVGGLILVLFAASAWIGVQHLGYAEFSTTRQMFLKGSFRRLIDSNTRLAQLAKALHGAGTLEECWLELSKSARELGFAGARVSYRAHVYGGEPPLTEGTQYWQQHIPIDEELAVDVWRAYQDDWMSGVSVANGFANIVHSALRGKKPAAEATGGLEAGAAGRIESSPASSSAAS